MKTTKTETSGHCSSGHRDSIHICTKSIYSLVSENRPVSSWTQARLKLLVSNINSYAWDVIAYGTNAKISTNDIQRDISGRL